MDLYPPATDGRRTGHAIRPLHRCGFLTCRAPSDSCMVANSYSSRSANSNGTCCIQGQYTAWAQVRIDEDWAAHLQLWRHCHLGSESELKHCKFCEPWGMMHVELACYRRAVRFLRTTRDETQVPHDAHYATHFVMRLSVKRVTEGCQGVWSILYTLFTSQLSPKSQADFSLTQPP